jgi:hypothetical protein
VTIRLINNITGEVELILFFGLYFFRDLLFDAISSSLYSENASFDRDYIVVMDDEA